MLQAFVPAGLMPQAASDGWLKFCPDGMPVSVMVALFGHEHHHHHAGHANLTEGEHSSSPHSTAEYQQCDLGGGLAAEFVSATTLEIASLPTAESYLSTFASSFYPSTPRNYHTRAPPFIQKNQLT